MVLLVADPARNTKIEARMAVDLPTLIAIRRRMENLRGFSRLGFRAQRVRPFRVSVLMQGNAAAT